MKRLFRIMGILVLAGLLLPVGIVSAKTVKFTFGTANSPKDFSIMAMAKWQKDMKAASKGELDMNMVTGGALGGDKQLLQQLAANEIQVHIAGPVVVHHLAKEYQCMEAEFVYKDEEHGYRVWNGGDFKEVTFMLRRPGLYGPYADENNLGPLQTEQVRKK